MNWMVLPYKRYFDFSGRSRRKEFWLFALFQWLVSVLIRVVFGMPMLTGMQTGFMITPALMHAGPGQILLNIFGLVTLIPGIAVAVRRLHDIDKSGWWYLLIFVPVLGWIALLVFFCRDGTPSANRFGEDPQGRGLYGVFN